MTPRFPRTEALIPDDVLAKLVENGRTSEERDGFDPFPVVKLFTPDAGATWLITEAYPEASDVRLFGLCDLGMGCPELGYLMLSEIEDVRGKLGLPVERDLHFKAEHRLSTYTENARRAGSPSSNREADMIALIVVTIMLIGMMCVLAYTLAIYALPFMLALAAARFAYGTGAGWIGAGVVGFVAGAASFGILTFLFAMLRAPILRIALALIFAAPAAVAGYALVHGVTAEAVPLPVWRQIFCLAGGALVGAAAAMRLAASAASQS